MGLQACNECGEQVSEHAPLCPNCGIARATWRDLKVNVDQIDVGPANIFKLMFFVWLASIPFAFIMLVMGAFGLSFLGALAGGV